MVAECIHLTVSCSARYSCFKPNTSVIGYIKVYPQYSFVAPHTLPYFSWLSAGEEKQ
jgi:hypothetical protein